MIKKNIMNEEMIYDVTEVGLMDIIYENKINWIVIK